jgi:uncharacterized protein (DUF1778 family)
MKENKLTERIVVRLTPDEKTRLLAAANAEGFRTVSQYVLHCLSAVLKK